MESGTNSLGLHRSDSPSIRSEPLTVKPVRFHCYREDKATLGSEMTLAALARVETALRCLGLQAPGQFSDGKQDSKEKPLGEQSGILLELMKRESALRQYLEQNPDSALSAWAAASGDAAFMRALRKDGWEPRRSRWLGLVKSIAIPGLLIALTAYLGNFVATRLQRAAFKHQKTFDLRLEGLLRGQDRSAELYTSVNGIFSVVTDAEAEGFTDLTPTELRVQRQRMESINAAARLYDAKGAVGAAIKDAAAVLDQYIECLDGKSENEGPSTTPMNCSQRHRTIPSAFDGIVDAHTIAMAELLKAD